MESSESAEDLSNRLFEREQEGFGRSLSVPADEVPRCSSAFTAYGYGLADPRGDVPGKTGPHRDRNYVEWETTPAESGDATVFTWMGGSQLRPAMRPAFPYAAATLTINGQHKIRFLIGSPAGWDVTEGDIRFQFEPRRFLSMVEPAHRMWSPHGVTGFYRLTVPGKCLKKGEAVKLRVELPPSKPDLETFFFVSPRSDALKVSLRAVREEVNQLQKDLVALKMSHEMLYAQVYPQLFPARIKGQLVIPHQDDTRHLHPANVTVLADGEIVITAREGIDHLAIDGRMVMVRSKDNGRTWGPKEVMYDLGKSDHRSAPIFELPNGDWVTTDYRAGAEYAEDEIWSLEYTAAPTQWGAWSTDRGRTWHFCDEPMVVPGALPYAETERHIIRLPSGRLLVAANYLMPGPDGKFPAHGVYLVAVFRSDDDGRSWQVHSTLAPHPALVGECSMLQTPSGKILIVSRSKVGTGENWDIHGMLLQSVSRDEGETWDEWESTDMSSMSSPGHLLQLADGRILCTHAARAYPGSIYVTVSRDEGETWDTAGTQIITNDLQNFDSCYPNSGQMADGTLITTWYANLFGRFYIAALLYQPDQLGVEA